jgi:hypothetical protein
MVPHIAHGMVGEFKANAAGWLARFSCHIVVEVFRLCNITLNRVTRK